MSIKPLILSALSCIFFITTAFAVKIVAYGNNEKHKTYHSINEISDVKKRIKRHTEPKYINTFMIFSNDELKCLALNVYHEARNESLSGKMAVMLVTINRVTDERFPGTICQVVHQGKHYYHKTLKKKIPRKDRCQFSWYCDGRSDIPRNRKAWVYSQALAEYFLKRSMLFIDFTEGATHYHANYIPLPRWAKNKKFKKTVSIDTHLFYRWENGSLIAMK